MKKYYSLAVACIALLFCSCQKERLDTPITNTSSDAAFHAAASVATLPSANTTVNYGALIDAPSEQGSLDFQVNVANQLGISCLRSRTQVPAVNKTAILNTAYKVLLNFNTGKHGTLSPFVTNLTQYQKDLKTILAGFSVMPVVAVIENEESNAGYYNGTAQEYIRQLKAAIEVMHASGIRVANGGLTSTGLNYLVYQDFLAQGKTDSAEQFKVLARVAPKSPTTQERGAFINSLLQSYAQMELDYVNFHWKATSTDMQAVGSVINYLKKVTGKAVISNELGQFDTNPNTLTALVQKCKEAGFPYIIWYSPDPNAGKKGTPLQYSNATLTPSGIAYQSYPKL